MGTRTLMACAMAGVLALPPCARGDKDPIAYIVRADRAGVERLPGLSVYEHGKELRVEAVFPDVPGFICDAWCYENEVTFLGARALGGGALELRHRIDAQPELVLVTEVRPGPGAVTFEARVEAGPAFAGPLPEPNVTPNLCWQLRRAASFTSRPDPYPEFVKRCFIFTKRGRTFLHETARLPIPVRDAQDPYNNPPWVQMYVGAWQEVPGAGPGSWAAYSPDQYTKTVIGAVSRDGKHLAAIVNDTAQTMCQAWHDCMHNNATWAPPDGPVASRRWRVSVYVMENDPAALLARAKADYPALRESGAE